MYFWQLPAPFPVVIFFFRVVVPQSSQTWNAPHGHSLSLLPACFSSCVPIVMDAFLLIHLSKPETWASCVSPPAPSSRWAAHLSASPGDSISYISPHLSSPAPLLIHEFRALSSLTGAAVIARYHSDFTLCFFPICLSFKRLP